MKMIYSKYGYRRLVKLLLDFTGRDIYDLVMSSKLLLWLRHTFPSENKSIANIHASFSIFDNAYGNLMFVKSQRIYAYSEKSEESE